MAAKADLQSAFSKFPVLESLRGQIQDLEEKSYSLLETMKSFPENQLRNECVTEISRLFSITNAMKRTLDACSGQDSIPANPINTDDGSAKTQFEERLDDLRDTIKSKSPARDYTKPQPSSGDRRKIVLAWIRCLGWSLSALVFVAVLLVGWNNQIAEIPVIVFVAILVSAVFVCLTALSVLVARRFVS